MSERKAERRERDWEDAIYGGEDGGAEPWERTYRDGSARNECWGSEEAGGWGLPPEGGERPE